MLTRAKQWARTIKRDVHALYLVSRDPSTPWYVKALAIFVAGYALSPIDLIPDFIPVLGYLDDIVIVPIGIWVVVRLVPPEVMQRHREIAAAAQDRPESYVAAGIIIAIWVLTLLASAYWIGRDVLPLMD